MDRMCGRNLARHIRATSILSLACLGLAGILAAQVTVNTGSGNGNGVLMTEGSSAISTGSGQDSIFAALEHPPREDHKRRWLRSGIGDLAMHYRGLHPVWVYRRQHGCPGDESDRQYVGDGNAHRKLQRHTRLSVLPRLTPRRSQACRSTLTTLPRSSRTIRAVDSAIWRHVRRPSSLSGNTLSIAGYSIPWFTVSGPVPSTAVTFRGTANRETLWGAVLTFPLTTTQITYDVGTADTSGTHQYGLGILNSSGSVVVHIGPTAGSTLMTSGFHTVSWVEGSTTLQPGKYYLVITSSCTATCAALAGANTNIMTFINASVQTITTGGTVQSVSPPADSYSVVGNVPAFVAQ